MQSVSEVRPLATLWNLASNNDRLRCAIYRTETGLELRVELPAAVVISEKFDLQPRALARAQALRDSLKRRGWQDVS